MKVIKSGEKGFEQEKAKMFSGRGLTKKEQLRLVFNHLLTAFLIEYDMVQYGGSEEELKEKYIKLLYEVKIRTKEERI